MVMESQGGDSWVGQSPGGFEFGVQGWSWGAPVPRSITFFLDNTAMVLDQYGRTIRRAVTQEGQEVRFADCAPVASREGYVEPRPQFATHAQVIEALRAERVDWLSYEVRYRMKDGAQRVRGGLSLAKATELQAKLIADGTGTQVVIAHAIEWAGWPQLPYEQLKQMQELPPTPAEELKKIRSIELRRDALRARREADEERAAEMVAEEVMSDQE